MKLHLVFSFLTKNVVYYEQTLKKASFDLESCPNLTVFCWRKVRVPKNYVVGSIPILMRLCLYCVCSLWSSCTEAFCVMNRCWDISRSVCLFRDTYTKRCVLVCFHLHPYPRGPQRTWVPRNTHIHLLASGHLFITHKIPTQGLRREHANYRHNLIRIGIEPTTYFSELELFFRGKLLDWDIIPSQNWPSSHMSFSYVHEI
jgi:hypothetical protein